MCVQSKPVEDAAGCAKCHTVLCAVSRESLVFCCLSVVLGVSSVGPWSFTLVDGVDPSPVVPA